MQLSPLSPPTPTHRTHLGPETPDHSCGSVVDRGTSGSANSQVAQADPRTSVRGCSWARKVSLLSGEGKESST